MVEDAAVVNGSIAEDVYNYVEGAVAQLGQSGREFGCTLFHQ